ncbi:MAG: SpoIVB peptidase S55 domain-containing protein, partial [Thermoanaerobaculia bacterium]
MHSKLCTSTCLLVLALLIGVGAAPGRAEAIFPLAEVKPGLQGYGLSVFAGLEPERFEVEIIGIWSNLRPGTSYILAELSGHGLEESGVIAGMSGSPVYLDGRLAGAVAFGWPFSHRAVAGITPIETMRELWAEQGSAASVVGSFAPTLKQLAAVDLPSDLLGNELALLEPVGAGQGVPGLLWTTVGFG